MMLVTQKRKTEKESLRQKMVKTKKKPNLVLRKACGRTQRNGEETDNSYYQSRGSGRKKIFKFGRD